MNELGIHWLLAVQAILRLDAIHWLLDCEKKTAGHSGAPLEE